jgi:hypothetical protein
MKAPIHKQLADLNLAICDANSTIGYFDTGFMRIPTQAEQGLGTAAMEQPDYATAA